MVNFDNPPCCYWSEKVKIEHLQRRILIYSQMYYENNESCVSDYFYDSVSQQLARMQENASEDVLKSTKYYNAFKDFDGSTGFDLISKLSEEEKNHIRLITSFVYDSWKKYG